METKRTLKIWNGLILEQTKECMFGKKLIIDNSNYADDLINNLGDLRIK